MCVLLLYNLNVKLCGFYLINKSKELSILHKNINNELESVIIFKKVW